MKRFVLLFVCVAILSGCRFWRNSLDPMKNQVIQAESGDRFGITLPAGGKEGLRWLARSDDHDVTVKIDHDDDEASAVIRIHRGFDGPANVTFTARQKSGTPPEDFTVSVFKRTVHAAFWEQ